jgi:hypothetical protein
MIDTIKIILMPKDLGFSWDIEEIKSNLQPVENFNRDGYKPLGRIKNIYVYGNNQVLKIEGSLAKYYNKNNVEVFDWRFVKPAIELLSFELGLPLSNGRISRIDIGTNIGLNSNVSDYFAELIFLEYYQRISRHQTTLRFENNSHRINFLLYDKLRDFSKRKLIKDIDLKYFTSAENLMRVELQIQERVGQIMNMKDLRVSSLFNQTFCKLLMKKWLDSYQNIHKKAVLVYPITLKGNSDFEKFIKRYMVQILGWEILDFVMKKAVKQGSLTPSDKSKKLKQFRLAMLDNSNFEFQEHTLELNHKVKVMYVESLKQIYKLN